jgi:hypothetical protein
MIKCPNPRCSTWTYDGKHEPPCVNSTGGLIGTVTSGFENATNCPCPTCTSGDIPASAPQTEGRKDDSDKPRMDLLPAYALGEIAKVLTFGAKKYAPNNWAKGIAFSRLNGALLRHMGAWAAGEDKDQESGLSHLAHAGCCILFLIWMNKFRADLDDRFKDPAMSPAENGEKKNGI